MKRTLMLLTGKYLVELRKHMQAAPGASVQPALRLGRRAVVLGLETLELARMHEQALAVLNLPKSEDGLQKRAEIFFTEALTPIVQTHRAARQSKVDLHRLTETLNRRTLELAASNRRLQSGLARRKSVEAALKANGHHYTKLLKESLHLQRDLRQLTHEVLAAQEEERKKVSHELQDEIAQTLLGINARLLSLKKEAKANTKGLKNEIASTQLLVVKSARSVRQAARGLRNA